MTIYTRRVSSPFGDFVIGVDRRGTLVRIAFGDKNERWSGPVIEDRRRTAAAARQLEEYFAGERQTFDLPHDAAGTAFQRDVWRAVARIPFGVTCSYADIAAAIGRPRACRAVGAANRANPLPIVIPCHRVIGKSGSLTGYGGGIDRKQALLQFERKALEGGSVPQRAIAAVSG